MKPVSIQSEGKTKASQSLGQQSSCVEQYCSSVIRQKCHYLYISNQVYFYNSFVVTKKNCNLQSYKS
jgi:hypothetical protein